MRVQAQTERISYMYSTLLHACNKLHTTNKKTKVVPYLIAGHNYYNLVNYHHNIIVNPFPTDFGWHDLVIKRPVLTFDFSTDPTQVPTSSVVSFAPFTYMYVSNHIHVHVHVHVTIDSGV